MWFRFIKWCSVLEDREAFLWLLVGVAIAISAVALVMAFSKGFVQQENRRVVVSKDEEGRIVISSG